MKTIVISYSLTGNNQALAAGIASEFSSEHISITESKPRTNAVIAFDMLLNRTPKVDLTLDSVADNDLVIFVGPVWMGMVAAPLRAYFKQLKPSLDKYVFVSISGGADGPNPKLAGELRKRTGKAPLAVIDRHIADLLPTDPQPTREDTSSYRLTDEDVSRLSSEIVKTLRDTVSG